MTLYRIIIPAYIQEIEAKNETEALELFWYNFDMAQQDPEWGNPTIKIISPKKTETRKTETRRKR